MVEKYKMCGLFGMVSTSTLSMNEKNAFEHLGGVSSARGEDSTGVVSLNLVKFPNTKEKDLGTSAYYSLHKEVISSPYYFNHKGWKDIKAGMCEVLIGHTRSATVGEISKAAAQPFFINRVTDEEVAIVGCHNGTLHGYIDKEKDKEFASDSHKLYTKISKSGLKEALEGLGSRSAYALCFYNFEEDSLNFFKNKDRPLVFGLSKDKKLMVWASERRFIESTNIMYSLNITDYYQLPNNTLVNLVPIKFSYTSEITWDIKKDFLDKRVIDLHESFSTPIVSNYSVPRYNHASRGYSYYPYSANKGENDNSYTNPYDIYDTYEENYGARASWWGKDKDKVESTPLDVASVFNNEPKIISYSYDHVNGVLRAFSERKVVGKPNEKVTLIFLRHDVKFFQHLHSYHKQEMYRLKIPYISLVKNDSLNISFYKTPNKLKTKVIHRGHGNYVGWLMLLKTQDEEFERWASPSKVITTSLENFLEVCTYDELCLTAQKLAKEDKTKKIGVIDNYEKKLPLGLESPKKKYYYQYGLKGQAEIKLAISDLNKGCYMCGEKKEIQDKVYWTNFSRYICEQCNTNNKTINGTCLEEEHRGRVFSKDVVEEEKEGDIKEPFQNLAKGSLPEFLFKNRKWAK